MRAIIYIFYYEIISQGYWYWPGTDTWISWSDSARRWKHNKINLIKFYFTPYIYFYVIHIKSKLYCSWYNSLYKYITAGDADIDILRYPPLDLRREQRLLAHRGNEVLHRIYIIYMYMSRCGPWSSSSITRIHYFSQKYIHGMYVWLHVLVIDAQKPSVISIRLPNHIDHKTVFSFFVRIWI